MATTIQVSHATKQVLDLLKSREKALSYDQVIQHLARIHARVPQSMFGAIKGIKWNKKEDRCTFHEL